MRLITYGTHARRGGGRSKILPTRAYGTLFRCKQPQETSALRPQVFVGTRAHCNRTLGHSIVVLVTDWQSDVDALPAPTAGPLLTNQPGHLHAFGNIPLGVDLRHAKLTVAEYHLRRLQAVAFADLGGRGVA